MNESEDQGNNNNNPPPPPVENPLQQLVDILKNAFQNHQPGNHAEKSPFKAFKDVHPPEFKGTTDPTEAQIWIKEIEKAFRVAQTAENMKTTFAAYMLKGEANFWWETIEAREENKSLEWNRFKELFLEKYFPPCLESQMDINFLELKQGDMSIAEYVNKFNELARFAPHQVNTEARKARRFEQGLNKWIRSKVSVLELKDFSILVQKTLIVESTRDNTFRFDQNNKRRFEAGSDNADKRTKLVGNQVNELGNKGSKHNANQNGNRNNKGINLSKDCNNCGKRHGGSICLKGKGVCYNCGESGHMAPECPSPKIVRCYGCGAEGHIARDCPRKDDANCDNKTKVGTSGPPYRATARTFNMTVKDAVDSNDAM